MKNINLTTVGLFVFLVATSLWGARQCSDKRDLKRVAFSYEECLQESTMSEYRLAQYHKAKQKVIRDSLNYYKTESISYRQQANQTKARIRAKESYIQTLSDSIGKLSTKASLEYIDSNFTPGGEDVIVTENQVKEIHTMNLERIALKEITIEQRNVIELLDESIEECMRGYALAAAELNTCQVDNMRKDLKVKSLKRKVRNRSVLGGIVTGLLVVALL